MLEFNVDVYRGNLKIKKRKIWDNEVTRIPNMQFKVYCEELNKWVKEGTTAATYVDSMEEATTYTTKYSPEGDGTGGNVTIVGIYSGPEFHYEVVEIGGDINDEFGKEEYYTYPLTFGQQLADEDAIVITEKFRGTETTPIVTSLNWTLEKRDWAGHDCLSIGSKKDGKAEIEIKGTNERCRNNRN